VATYKMEGRAGERFIMVIIERIARPPFLVGLGGCREETPPCPRRRWLGRRPPATRRRKMERRRAGGRCALRTPLPCGGASFAASESRPAPVSPHYASETRAASRSRDTGRHAWRDA